MVVGILGDPVIGTGRREYRLEGRNRAFDFQTSHKSNHPLDHLYDRIFQKVLKEAKRQLRRNLPTGNGEWFRRMIHSAPPRRSGCNRLNSAPQHGPQHFPVLVSGLVNRGKVKNRKALEISSKGQA
jgi:hypothetical protein